MAKKQTPQQHTLARIARTEAYAEKVRRLFAYTVNQICEMNKRMPDIENGIMYSFDGDSKKVQQEVEMLLRQLHAVTTAAIKQGIELEWEQANEECDKLVQSCFGREVLKDPMFDAYTTHNERAMNAFIARSERGLNLSDRVWKSVRQLRDEMEVAITVSVGEGASAQQISKRVREYLDDPDLMFRRFRYKAGVKEITDENGKVIGEVPIYGRKWKKRIKKDDGSYGWIDYDRDSYRTGAGVYKSSAKNAMRVARTETNIAYRRADNERWSQMDFVLGQRIQLSRQHPKEDICDKLQGDYPTEFVFEGWHPQCFCFVTPILMDADEMRKARQARLRGETYVPKAKRITDYPQAFKDWVSDNKEKIVGSHDVGQDPYFVRHNYDIVQRILNPKAEPTLFEKQTEQIDKLQQYLQDGFLPKETTATLDKLRSLAEAGDDAAAAEFERRATLLQTAAERHAARTPEKIADIKQRWQERNEFNAASAQAEQLSQLAHGTHIDTSAFAQAIQQRDTAKIKLLVAQVKQKLEHIKLAASNVSKLAQDYGEVDATALDDLMSADEFNYASVQAATRKLAQDILAQKKAEQALTDLIPDAHKWHQQFSMNDLQAAHTAIKKTLARWTWDLTTDKSLDFLKGRLEREISIVENSSYATKEIAKQAYQKRLDLVNKRIDMKKIGDTLTSELQFGATTRSKIVIQLCDEIKALLNDNNTDIAILRAKATSLKQKVAQLQRQAQRRKVCSVAVMSDTEINDKVRDLFARHGAIIKSSDIKVVDGAVNLTADQFAKLGKFTDITDAEKRIIMSNSSGGYIGTSNSFTINGALRDIKGCGNHAIHGKVRGNPNVKKAQDKYGSPLSNNDITTIETLDAVIARNSLPFPIRLTRNLDSDAIINIFGLPITCRAVSAVDAALSSSSNVVMQKDCGYMSASAVPKANVFSHRQFTLEIEVPAGANIYVSHHTFESECILGREVPLQYISHNVVGGRLIIKCRVQP